jgi:hypothetical protein
MQRSINVYGYANGNPVKFTDLSGEASPLSVPIDWLENKISETFYKGWAKDWVKEKLADKFYKGSLYAEGGFALPKEVFDFLADLTSNIIFDSPQGLGLQVLTPTELNKGENEWLREQERLRELRRQMTAVSALLHGTSCLQNRASHKSSLTQ